MQSHVVKGSFILHFCVWALVFYFSGTAFSFTRSTYQIVRPSVIIFAGRHCLQIGWTQTLSSWQCLTVKSATPLTAIGNVDSSPDFPQWPSSSPRRLHRQRTRLQHDVIATSIQAAYRSFVMKSSVVLVAAIDE